MKSHVHIFQHVAEGHISSEEGAEWMMSYRWQESYERLYRITQVFFVANAIAWFVFAVTQ